MLASRRVARMCVPRRIRANATHRVFIKREIDDGYNFCQGMNNDEGHARASYFEYMII